MHFLANEAAHIENCRLLLLLYVVVLLFVLLQLLLLLLSFACCLLSFGSWPNANCKAAAAAAGLDHNRSDRGGGSRGDGRLIGRGGTLVNVVGVSVVVAVAAVYVA